MIKCLFISLSIPLERTYKVDWKLEVRLASYLSDSDESIHRCFPKEEGRDLLHHLRADESAGRSGSTGWSQCLFTPLSIALLYSFSRPIYTPAICAVWARKLQQILLIFIYFSASLIRNSTYVRLYCNLPTCFSLPYRRTLVSDLILNESVHISSAKRSAT